MQVGDMQTWERTFTEEDVQLFVKLSGDRATHHLYPDPQGRIMVQGLLTATLPTRIGGEWNLIAQEMVFEFARPVFVGDSISCKVRITHFEKTEQRINMRADIVCRNQHGKEVLRGHTTGIVRIPTYELIGCH